MTPFTIPGTGSGAIVPIPARISQIPSSSIPVLRVSRTPTTILHLRCDISVALAHEPGSGEDSRPGGEDDLDNVLAHFDRHRGRDRSSGLLDHVAGAAVHQRRAAAAARLFARGDYRRRQDGV